MRKLSRLLLALAFAVGASAQAGAVDLTLTGGDLGVSIGALPPILFPAQSAPILDVSDPGQGGGFVEPASVFTGSVMLSTSLFTGVALINGLTVGNLANLEKSIAPGNAPVTRGSFVVGAGGGLGGPGPLTGSAFVNVLGLFNLTVPLNIVGQPGATTSVVAGTLAVTVRGTGWTTGTLMLTQVTTELGVPPVPENTVTYEGFDNRNANGTGVVQLISAFHITTNAAGNLPGLATQTLTFVPEPGTILMLLSGAVTLGIGGWLRMRSR